MKEYEIVFERKECLRNVIRVKADSQEKAEALAEAQNEEYDWNYSEIIHADENIVAVRIVEKENS